MPRTFGLEFNATHLRDLRGRFVKATAYVERRLDDSVHTLGKRWVELAQEQAPKRTGAFAEDIGYYIIKDEKGVGFVGTLPDPLGSYITEGTPPHTIRARRSGALHFFWVEQGGIETFVPSRGRGGLVRKQGRDGNEILIIGKGYVNHPGTFANPFTESVISILKDEANVAIRATIDGYRSIIFVGKKKND